MQTKRGAKAVLVAVSSLPIIFIAIGQAFAAVPSDWPLFNGLEVAPAGDRGGAITAADIDGDGCLDIARAGFMSNTVSVSFGNCHGLFSTASVITLGSQLQSFASGDFNGDGYPDMAVTDSVTNTVYVLLNTENGLFLPAATYLVGTAPHGVAVGDFNNDGRDDIATANSGDGTVSVLLANKDGSFTQSDSFPAGTNVETIASGDINGDGNEDLVVTDDGSIQLSYGNGNGTFSASERYATNFGSAEVAVTDLNNDDFADVIVAAYSSNTISLFKGAARGLASAGTITASLPGSLAVGDFNGDNVVDFAVTDEVVSGDSSDHLSIFYGRGDLAFEPAVHHHVGEVGWAASGDFNGDGQADLALDSSGRVTVILSAVDKPLPDAPFYPVNSSGQVDSLALADFNADGSTDIAAADYTYNQVVILTNDGRGNFVEGGHYAVDAGPYFIVARDINGDSITDLITANINDAPGSLSVLLGTASHGFLSAVRYALDCVPHDVAIGDVNNDRIGDLVVACTGSAYPDPGHVSVLLGISNGEFAPAVDYAAGDSPFAVAIGDFDEQGDNDIVVAPRGSSNIVLLKGDGSGTFAAPVAVADVAEPSFVVAHDFDGDGHLDLAVTAAQSDGKLVILKGSGVGTFASVAAYPIGFSPSFIALQDLDNDGHADLVVSTANYVATLRGNGDGTFLEPRAYFGGQQAKMARIADFNHDGAPDLATAAAGEFDPVSVLFQTHYAPITATAAGTLAENSNFQGALTAHGFYDADISYQVDAQPPHGHVDVDASTGAYIYTPALGYRGGDTFSFISGDGFASSAPTLVSMTVKNIPSVTRDGTVEAVENGSASGVFSVSNPANNPLQFSIVAAPKHGTVKISDAAHGIYTYTPSKGYAGSDRFTYKANDGVDDSNVSTVQVTVTAAPEAPPANSPDKGAGGGGGMLGLFGFLLLLLPLLRRNIPAA